MKSQALVPSRPGSAWLPDSQRERSCDVQGTHRSNQGTSGCSTCASSWSHCRRRSRGGVFAEVADVTKPFAAANEMVESGNIIILHKTGGIAKKLTLRREENQGHLQGGARTRVGTPKGWRMVYFRSGCKAERRRMDSSEEHCPETEGRELCE